MSKRRAREMRRRERQRRATHKARRARATERPAVDLRQAFSPPRTPDLGERLALGLAQAALGGAVLRRLTRPRDDNMGR